MSERDGHALLRERLVVVLVEPEQEGNLGAAARALGNLGVSTLRRVGGVAAAGTARAMACHFQDLLAQAPQLPTLSAALADCVYAVALVSPMRPREQTPLDLRSLGASLHEKAAHGKVALVFGSEQSGLPREAVEQCDAVAALFLPSSWPTLNLAQAVLLAAYELVGRGAPPAAPPLPVEPLANHAEVDGAFATLADTLLGLGYHDDPQTGLRPRILARARAIAQRAQLSRADLSMLQGLLARLSRGPGAP